VTYEAGGAGKTFDGKRGAASLLRARRGGASETGPRR